MDRGPLALFGAIVAVGLGPALWMGVQLGVARQGDPTRPPSIGEYAPEPAQNLLGGAGAGERTSDNTPVDKVPSSPSPSVTDPSPSVSPTRRATTPPTTRPTTEAPTGESPSGATSEPTVDPSDSNDPSGPDPSDPAGQDPSDTVPSTGDETDAPGDSDGGGSGEGDDDWWTYEDTDPFTGDYGNYASAGGSALR